MYSNLISINIPRDILLKAEEWAKKLDSENNGAKTCDGGADKNVKGCIGQWAVHKYLENNGWEHDYSPPYVEGQHGDAFDLRYNGEIWDVKCRSLWSDTFKQNTTLLMGENERHAKPCSWYIFCIPRQGFNIVYILGAKSYTKTWEELEELSPQAQAKMLFKSAGRVKVNNLTPIRDLIRI